MDTTTTTAVPTATTTICWPPHDVPPAPDLADDAAVLLAAGVSDIIHTTDRRERWDVARDYSRRAVAMAGDVTLAARRGDDYRACEEAMRLLRILLLHCQEVMEVSW